MSKIISSNLKTTGSKGYGHTVTGTVNESHTNWYHYQSIYDVSINKEGKIVSTKYSVNIIDDVVVEHTKDGVHFNGDIKFGPEGDNDYLNMSLGIVFTGKQSKLSENITAENTITMDYSIIESLQRCNSYS